MWRWILHELPGFLCWGCLAALSGCGGTEGPDRVVVSGKVTYQGEQVADGRIRFTPVQASELPTSGAFIIDGVYKADGNGGVPAGRYKVEIEAYRTISNPTHKKPSGSDDFEDSEEPRQQCLPQKYNQKTQLEVNIPSNERSFTYDFTLSD